MASGLSRVFRDPVSERFDRLFDEIGRALSTGNNPWVSAWYPSIEVREQGDEMQVEMEVPGVQPGDIDVRVENNVLTVRGERREDPERAQGRTHRQEFCYGAFVRSIALPATLDPEKVRAELKDGILRIQLPKAEAARSRRIEVQGAGRVQELPAESVRAGEAEPEREAELAGAGTGRSE
jgi:HSP20 family protein